MTSRSVVLALVILAAAATETSASELRLSVAGGAGAAASDPCSYLHPDCGEPRLRVAGAAPMVLAGIRGHVELRDNWRLRLGAAGSAFAIAGPHGDSATTATGAGEIGIEHENFGFDMIGGVSNIRVTQDQMTRRGISTMVGFSVSAKVSPTLAIVTRLDLHVAQHGAIGSAFLGAGLEWTPKL